MLKVSNAKCQMLKTLNAKCSKRQMSNTPNANFVPLTTFTNCDDVAIVLFQLILGNVLDGSSGPPNYIPQWGTHQNYSFAAHYFFEVLNATTGKVGAGTCIHMHMHMHYAHAHAHAHAHALVQA